METIAKDDLKLSPYKMRKRQYLTPAQKHKRIESDRFLLGELKAGTAQREIVFSDEKLFTIEATVNNLSDRVYAKSSEDIDESVRTVLRLLPWEPCLLQILEVASDFRGTGG